jgi:undecaprenyl-diphosphatase
MLALAAVSNHGFTTFRAIVLGFLQGISELFPISSLGHTVLFPHLFGWNRIVAFQSRPESPWLAFIVMLHVGSALGLLAYFWRDWVRLIRALFATLSKRRIETADERLIWLLIVASIPTGILGLAFEHLARTATSKPEIAAIFLVINGLVLFGAQALKQRGEARRSARVNRSERRGETAHAPRALDSSPAASDRRLARISYREAALMGVAQSGGLIAGISRDGMVMAGGLARGMENFDAARLSFLMATPIILVAGLYKIPDLIGPNGNGVRGAAVIAAVVAAIVSVFAVHFLTRYFRRGNLRIFALYCVLFGVAMVIYNA